MDADDFFTARPDDPLKLLARQDIDPMSVDELNARITALEAEITRTRNRIQFAAAHKASADALFKKS